MARGCCIHVFIVLLLAISKEIKRASYYSFALEVDIGCGLKIYIIRSHAVTWEHIVINLSMALIFYVVFEYIC